MIGGGIAGAAACLRLADLGRPPLWIAPPLAGDDKPGEHLAATARPLLARLGYAEAQIETLIQSGAAHPADTEGALWAKPAKAAE